jgi:magnesium transporter
MALEENPELLRCGPGAVLHAIVDRVVDDYQPALAGLEEDLGEVERDVFSSDRSNPAERIYKLQREVQEFSRAASPLIAPLDRLARGAYDHVHGEVQTYFRDVYDHIVRVEEQLQSAHDMLTGALQNEDVRKISAIVAILAVPTMIAGVYGMNFDHMPELTWTFGYPLVIGVMLTICFGLYRYFKSAGWL